MKVTEYRRQVWSYRPSTDEHPVDIGEEADAGKRIDTGKGADAGGSSRHQRWWTCSAMCAS
jgi:hypothetical protein